MGKEEIQENYFAEQQHHHDLHSGAIYLCVRTKIGNVVLYSS